MVMRRELMWMGILAAAGLIAFEVIRLMVYYAKLEEFWAWVTGVSMFLNVFAVRTVFHYRNRVEELRDLMGSGMRVRRERNERRYESLLPPEPEMPHETRYLPDEYPSGDPEVSVEDFNRRR